MFIKLFKTEKLNYIPDAAKYQTDFTIFELDRSTLNVHCNMNAL